MSIVSTIYRSILHLIYPRQCLCCKEELASTEENFCVLCKNELHLTNFENYDDASSVDKIFWGRLQLKNVFSLIFYRDNHQSRQILHQLKYNNRPDLAQYMGKMIGETIQNKPNFQSIDLLVSIPIHFKKRYTRGYNQSEEIVKGIHDCLKIPYDFELVQKMKHHESQTKKNKEERWQNVQHTFQVKDTLPAHVQHIALVDDVLTTGATLETVIHAIQEKHSVEISILTVAYAGG